MATKVRETARLDENLIEIKASKAKTASRGLVLKEWLLKHRRPAGLVLSHRNVAFELHKIPKTAN